MKKYVSLVLLVGLLAVGCAEEVKAIPNSQA